MSEPILANRCDDINLDLIMDVLLIAMIRDSAGLHFRVTQVCIAHVSIVLLFLVSWLDSLVRERVQLGSIFVDILVPHLL